MNTRLSLTTQAHTIIESHINKGDIVIDATVGNGHDTSFLAGQVGIDGIVFGFDIQQQAINATELKLKQSDQYKNTKLFHVSHCELEAYIPSNYHRQIKAIIFNLGYLPGSDKVITTQSKSTLMALDQSIKILGIKGLISIIAYPGHASGAIESNNLTLWFNELNSSHFYTKLINSSSKENAPRLFIIQKLC